MRSKVSKKNSDYISQHNYLELKHFCLQYNEWKESYISTDGYSKAERPQHDPTPKAAELREVYFRRMKLVEDSAMETSAIIGGYILESVTTGKTYDQINALSHIPCGRRQFYELYRRFFYILSIKKLRGEQSDRL